MIALFALFASAKEDCKEQPKDLTFSINKATIEGNETHYYYTHHGIDGDKLTFKLYSEKSLIFNVVHGIQCPEKNGDTTYRRVHNGGVLTVEFDTSKGDGSVDQLGIVNFAVFNDGQSAVDYTISVSGQNPNNFDAKEHVVLTGVFLGLCILLLVLFFVHSILARDKVYYKVDVQE